VIKNPDDTGDNYATLMEPGGRGADEQCNQYSTCSVLNAYLGTRPSSTPSTTWHLGVLPADITAGITGPSFP